MEIRNNASGNNPRIDFTQSIRKSISDSAPVEPAKSKQPAAAADLPVNPKRIKNARAAFHAEQSVLKRVRDARDRYEKEHANDNVSVSAEAQELARAAAAPAADRSARVSELKVEHASGRLDVNGMVAEAAYRMLSGE
jgi:anti-sigma28 factor (negative regulator of flagellin synthesis)